MNSRKPKLNLSVTHLPRNSVCRPSPSDARSGAPLPLQQYSKRRLTIVATPVIVTFLPFTQSYRLIFHLIHVCVIMPSEGFFNTFCTSSKFGTSTPLNVDRSHYWRCFRLYYTDGPFSLQSSQAPGWTRL